MHPSCGCTVSPRWPLVAGHVLGAYTVMASVVARPEVLCMLNYSTSTQHNSRLLSTLSLKIPWKIREFDIFDFHFVFD